MKSVVSVNCAVPTVEDALTYLSDRSLRDYDIVIFDPELPPQSRIQFDAGGSCISIEGAKRLAKASAHWSGELKGALAAGKTVFVRLSPYEEDQAAYGSTHPAKNRTTYQTTVINNYTVIPANVRVKNARGRNIAVKDSAYKDLYDSIKEITEYRVVFEGAQSMHTAFTAKDGTAVGGMISFQDEPGCLVLLPYFDFEADIDYSDDGDEV